MSLGDVPVCAKSSVADDDGGSTATASTSPPVKPLHILLFIVEIILVVHVEVFLEESTLSVERRLRSDGDGVVILPLG